MKRAVILIASDHAGFSLKEKIKCYFDDEKIAYRDLGPFNYDKHDDYPDYAFKLSLVVSKNKNALGILICGTGTGMVIAANKVRNIRAVAAYDMYSARLSRQHNNANILCLPSRHFPFSKVRLIIKTWLYTPFSYKPRHIRRIKKINSFLKSTTT